MSDGGKTVSTFISKLYNMLEDISSNSVISWSPSGSSFIVTVPMEFQDVILPKFFKHSNFSSFVRQLNLYGFHKVGEPQFWEFQHEHFIRGQKDLLPLIKRRTGSSQVEKAIQPPTRPQRDVGASVAPASASRAAPLSEMQELRLAHAQMNDRLNKLTEDYSNVWKKLLVTNQALVDTQSKLKRVLQVFCSMVFGEEEASLPRDKRLRQAPAEPMPDLGRTSIPQFDFNRISQLNMAQALGRLSDTNMGLRSMSSMRYVPLDAMSQLRSGMSLTQIPSINEAPGDPDYEMWMKELAEAGVVDSTGNPVNIQSLTTMSQPAIAPLGLAQSLGGMPGSAMGPGGPGSIVQSEPSRFQAGAMTGSMSTMPSQPTTRPASPDRERQSEQRAKRGREEEVAGAMMALRRSSTGMMPAQIISPMYRDMLRQVLQELRADDSFGQSAALPVVSAGDVSIINTPQAFSGSGAGGTALLGGPQFDRVFGLINELTAEVTRVCAMHQLPSTLRHIASSSSIGVWVSKRLDEEVTSAAPREPTAILLFK